MLARLFFVELFEFDWDKKIVVSILGSGVVGSDRDCAFSLLAINPKEIGFQFQAVFERTICAKLLCQVLAIRRRITRYPDTGLAFASHINSASTWGR